MQRGRLCPRCTFVMHDFHHMQTGHRPRRAPRPVAASLWRTPALIALALSAAGASARDCEEAVERVARRTDVDAWLQGERLPGVVLAAQSLRVSAMRGGRVEQVRVRAGAAVAKGDELLLMHSDALQRELQSASASAAISFGDVAAQRAEVERLEREQARRQAHPQLFAREEREAHDALLKSARARMQSAQARADEAAQRKQFLQTEQLSLRVLAPHAGRIGSVHVRVGEVIAEGAPLIELGAQAATMIRFALPASRADALRVGDSVCVVAADGATPPLLARVSRVAAEIATAAQTVVVEALPLVEPRSRWQGLSVDIFPLAEAGGARR